MIVPTATNLKFKFPEFASLADSDVEFAIEEASRNVDDSWLAKDQTLAVLYLSAHYLMVSIQRAASLQGQPIASERVGEMSITYQSVQLPTGKSDAVSDLTTTPYGTRFLELAHLNFPRVAVI